MARAMLTLSVFFAIVAAAFADIPAAQTNVGSEDVMDYDEAVAFFQLSAGFFGGSSSRPGQGSEGNGSALASLLKSRGKPPSAELQVLLAAVPRNRHGKIDAAAARYALHRLFVGQRGWRIEGLDPEGRAWNSSSLADVTLLRRLPKSALAELFEGWDEQGLSVSEVGLLASTIEHLIHQEAADRLAAIFELSGLPMDEPVSEQRAAEAVELCLASYIIGEKVSLANRRTWWKLRHQHKNMADIFPTWNDTRDWVRGIVADRARADGHLVLSGRVLAFADASRAMEAVGDGHGRRFQEMECRAMKRTLLNMEDGGTGRVRLADFYGDALNGKWQFQESVGYLRSNGALDEANPGNMRVIIPNYVNGLSNCIGASDYHSMCCISECEGIRAGIEGLLGKPFATPEEISSAIQTVSSRTTAASGPTDPVLMLRLKRIASDNGGQVPVFGRLFAQWLHHAYPRECEFPHLSGKTSPLDVYDMEQAGMQVLAATKDMESYAAVKRRKGAPVEAAPWVHHEELFGGEDPAASKVPPLFVAFHAGLFVTAGLGMGWLARVVCVGYRSRRAKASRKASEVFLPPAMV